MKQQDVQPVLELPPLACRHRFKFLGQLVPIEELSLSRMEQLRLFG
jgi:hypothetical protein